MRLKKLLLFLSVIFFTALAGYFMANMLSGNRSDAMPMDRQAEREKFILSKLDFPLEAGDRLPDSQFMTLDGHFVRLSEIISNRVIIAFIDHKSDYSRFQLKEFKRIIECDDKDQALIIISKSPIAELNALRDEFAIRSTFLLDIDGEYETSLGIIIFPFNIVVDSGLIIDAIKPGVLGREYIRDHCLSVS